ncbi:MAG TPA: basic amino acid ABC transporter substrate-binding protein [Trueperaceae bacterium]
MKRVTLALLLLAGLAVAQTPDLEGRVLSVGSDTTYPPFETVNEQGEIVGFDVDVVNAVCEVVNCVAEFQTTAWDGIFPALAAGEFDMVASGVTITEERDRVVDFTIPYFEVDQAITVRVGDADLTLEEFTADGSDLLLGAQTGTTNAATAEDLIGRDRVRLYDDFNSAIQGLLNGDVDGVMIDDVTADAFVQQYAGELVVNIREVESGDKLGFAVQEGDPLVDALNAGIEEIKANGTLDELIAEWFQSGN